MKNLTSGQQGHAVTLQVPSLDEVAARARLMLFALADPHPCVALLPCHLERTETD